MSKRSKKAELLNYLFPFELKSFKLILNPFFISMASHTLTPAYTAYLNSGQRPAYLPPYEMIDVC